MVRENTNGNRDMNAHFISIVHNIFFNVTTVERERAESEEHKETSLQHAMIAIKHKFSKNAILKGSNLQVGGMFIERNQNSSLSSNIISSYPWYTYWKG